MTNLTDSTVTDPNPNIAFEMARPPLLPVAMVFTCAWIRRVWVPVPTFNRIKL